MKNKISIRDIEKYYDITQILYFLFYSKGTNGLHYGLWDKNTKKPSDAINNTNKFIIECLKINSKDFVLDAGCGVGGTCIFIAEKTGARVSGITISDIQVKKAIELGNKSNSSKLLVFSKQDFTNTNFKDNTFSKIFGIESVCHAEKKIDFLRETYRILKKNGKIAIMDALCVRQDLDKKENKIYNKWLDGWAVPNLATKEGFIRDLKKTGFTKIKYYDKFNEIKRSRDRIYHLGFFGYPLSLVLSKIGIINKEMHANTLSCLYQKKVSSDINNIATYGVFVAEK